jgi:hypothetical protein
MISMILWNISSMLGDAAVMIDAFYELMILTDLAIDGYILLIILLMQIYNNRDCK